MLKVIVNRATWYRGEPTGSQLLREDGRMCCVGFMCSFAGLKGRHIKGCATVGALPPAYVGERGRVQRDNLPPIVATLAELEHSVECWDNGTPGHTLYRINDSSRIGDETREARLITEGLRLGIEFSFFN